MSSSFRAFAVGFLVFACAATSWAFDFGLTLSNDSLGSSEAILALTQTDKARAWATIPVGDDSSFYVSGFCELSGTIYAAGGSMPLRFDFDRTEYEGSVSGVLGPKSVLRYSIGRAYFIDFSSQVLSGLSDGARAELSIGNVSLQATGGYRGLLYKADARSYINAADQALSDNADAYFGPKRAFAALGLRYNELFKGHDLGIEGWTQIDLAGSGTTTNTAYIEPFVEGRFGRPFRWRAWGVYEIGYDLSIFSAMAAGSQIRFSIPDLAGFHLTQSCLWASGTAGAFRAFTPIRQGTLGSVSVLPFADAFSASLEASLTPLRGTSVGISGAAFLRASDNPPSGGTVRSDATGSFLGFEAYLQASAYPTSDLMFFMALGLFVPNTANMYVSTSPNRITVSLSASLSM